MKTAAAVSCVCLLFAASAAALPMGKMMDPPPLNCSEIVPPSPNTLRVRPQTDGNTINRCLCPKPETSPQETVSSNALLPKT